jgi:squalene-hopene/tetraprenyl-beta-curcumene cyclase
MVERAVSFLLSAQRADGGWGGAEGVIPTIEETALAVRALAEVQDGRAAASRGVRWLIDHVDMLDSPAPIGLYFASLWYYERLYPLVFAASAARTCALQGIEP